MNTKFILLVLAISIAAGAVLAQTPMVVVPAASSTAPATAASAPVAPSSADSTSLSAAIKLLEEMKATNAETLKKQEALLQQLDELQKAAEQAKAFSKRG
jgi:hypothetical protein